MRSTTPQRSRMMSSIRGKNTRPERILLLPPFARGFDIDFMCGTANGSPDPVFPKRRAVVFVHGCFWHRHEGCRYTTTPGPMKISGGRNSRGNVARDRRHAEMLMRSAGAWRSSGSAP